MKAITSYIHVYIYYDKLTYSVCYSLFIGIIMKAITAKVQTKRRGEPHTSDKQIWVVK